MLRVYSCRSTSTNNTYQYIYNPTETKLYSHRGEVESITKSLCICNMDTALHGLDIHDAGHRYGLSTHTVYVNGVCLVLYFQRPIWKSLHTMGLGHGPWSSIKFICMYLMYQTAELPTIRIFERVRKLTYWNIPDACNRSDTKIPILHTPHHTHRHTNSPSKRYLPRIIIYNFVLIQSSTHIEMQWACLMPLVDNFRNFPELCGSGHTWMTSL